MSTGPDLPPTIVDCEAIAGQGAGFYEDNVVVADTGRGPPLGESTPEAEGLNAALLAGASADLAARPALLSFLVIRNDAIVWEDYFNAAGPTDANNVHSASKSLISTLVGMAIERGDIDGVDQPVSELLPVHFQRITDPDKLAITVGHLLTMSAGLEWAEDSTEYEIEDEDDWVQAIIDRPLATTPGATFHYSTGLSHVMSAVLTEATGMSTCEFAHAVLLGPLGIDVERWGRDPQGYFSGGYNLFMTPRELAVFGLLHLRDGALHGRQLVPPGWVSASREHHFDDYGYFWWLLTAGDEDVQTAWGHGGQFVYIVPELDLVVVMTTDTSAGDPDFDGRSILADYVIPAAS